MARVENKTLDVGGRRAGGDGVEREAGELAGDGELGAEDEEEGEEEQEDVAADAASDDDDATLSSVPSAPSKALSWSPAVNAVAIERCSAAAGCERS